MEARDTEQETFLQTWVRTLLGLNAPVILAAWFHACLQQNMMHECISVTLHPLAAGSDCEVLPISWLKDTRAEGLWGGFGPWQHNRQVNQHLSHYSQEAGSLKELNEGFTLIDSMVFHNRWGVTFFNYESPGMPERTYKKNREGKSK